MSVHLYVPTPHLVWRSLERCRVCRARTRHVTRNYAAWTTWSCCRCGTTWDPSATRQRDKPKPKDKPARLAALRAEWAAALGHRAAWDRYEREHGCP